MSGMSVGVFVSAAWNNHERLRIETFVISAYVSAYICTYSVSLYDSIFHFCMFDIMYQHYDGIIWDDRLLASFWARRLFRSLAA